MSADKIREIKRNFSKSGFKIDYNNTFFQMLKRGIALYVSDLPNEYKWLVQKLMTEKSLGIVITDHTLCMGIDLPIRTTCLINYRDNSFSTGDYLQMSGRAGRRGLDNQGNIILYGKFDDKFLKGELPDINGLSLPSEKYDILCELNHSIHKGNIQKIYQYPFNNQSREIDFKNYKELTKVEKRLVWIFRDANKNILDLIRKIDIGAEIEIVKDLISFLDIGKDILESYQLLKIDNESYMKDIKRMIQLCENIHNYHSKKAIKEKMKVIHKKLYHIVFKDIFN
jgi:replicative superfamily II helicase